MFSAVHKTWASCTLAYGERSFLNRAKQHLRWSLLATRHPRRTIEWYNWLDSPEMRPFVEAHPGLVFKPLRSYLSVHWGQRRRTQVISDSYRFVQERATLLGRALLMHGGINLESFEGESVRIPIHLGYDQRFRREGEFALSLGEDALGACIAWAAFSIAQDEKGEWNCFVGCVQGGSAGMEGVRFATKVMFGMRPKAAIIFVLQEVARALGVTHLFGAGNSIQVHLRKHLIHLPAFHRLNFDYDTLWQELGGVATQDGWFRLPSIPIRRSTVEVKASKRAMYIRRYDMLDRTAARIHELFCNMPPSSAPNLENIAPSAKSISENG
jgi:uncharacterized protein VirK/YbjX